MNRKEWKTQWKMGRILFSNLVSMHGIIESSTGKDVAIASLQQAYSDSVNSDVKSIISFRIFEEARTRPHSYKLYSALRKYKGTHRTITVKKKAGK